jgi:hypothetical protein
MLVRGRGPCIEHPSAMGHKAGAAYDMTDGRLLRVDVGGDTLDRVRT